MAESIPPGSRCGTYAEYQQHRKRGEQSCEACCAAQRAYMEQRRRAQGTQPAKPPQPCGTRAAYRRHKSRGEDPCEPCIAAYREVHRVEEEQHRRRQGARPRLPLQPCGTEAGYRRHRKAGEVPCPDCLEAQRRIGRARYIPSSRTLAPCGTYPAYRRHVNAGEKPCAACTEARRAYAAGRFISTEKENSSRKGGRRHGIPLKTCGTFAAYTRHKRKGETPCARCVQAAQDYRLAEKARVPVKPCGTYAAYARHAREKEPACEDCQEAARAYQAGLRARKPAARKPAEVSCGTIASYRRHLRREESPCEECKAAWKRSYGKLRGPRKNTSPCGTYGAYMRHIRAREVPCGLCQRAHLEYGSWRRALELGATIAPLPPDFMMLLLARYGRQCGPVWQPGAGCGKPVDPGKETLDHIVPLTKGGLHCMENFQVMHRACNTRKGAKMPPPEVVARVLAEVAAVGYALWRHGHGLG